MFSNNIRTLYLYVVAFVALMAIIFGTVNLVQKVTNYIYPINNYNYKYEQPYSIYDETGDYRTTDAEKAEIITTEQKNAQNRTLREIFTSLATILVAIPLYSYHWAMAQKERKREEV